MPTKRKRLKPVKLVKLFNTFPEWRAEYRNGHVFAYWYATGSYLATYPVLSIADDSFLCKVAMRHSNHGNLHLDWYDLIYTTEDVYRITREVHRVFAFSRTPIDTKAANGSTN